MYTCRFGTVTGGLFAKCTMPKDQYNSTVPWKQMGRVDGAAQYGQGGVDETVVCRVDIAEFLASAKELPAATGCFNGGVNAMHTKDKKITWDRERAKTQWRAEGSILHMCK